MRRRRRLQDLPSTSSFLTSPTSHPGFLLLFRRKDIQNIPAFFYPRLHPHWRVYREWLAPVASWGGVARPCAPTSFYAPSRSRGPALGAVPSAPAPDSVAPAKATARHAKAKVCARLPGHRWNHSLKKQGIPLPVPIEIPPAPPYLVWLFVYYYNIIIVVIYYLLFIYFGLSMRPKPSHRSGHH